MRCLGADIANASPTPEVQAELDASPLNRPMIGRDRLRDKVLYYFDLGIVMPTLEDDVGLDDAWDDADIHDQIANANVTQLESYIREGKEGLVHLNSQATHDFPAVLDESEDAYRDPQKYKKEDHYYNPQTDEIDPPDVGRTARLRVATEAPEPELHAWGDLAADERGVPNDEKYPAEEGPRYHDRDEDASAVSIWYAGGPTDPASDAGVWGDVGEMIGLTDLLHQTNAGRRDVASKKEKTAMDANEAFDVLAAGLSPSRETTNIPSVVVEEAEIRLEHKKQRVEDRDGELGNEDEGTLNLLKEEEDRRGIPEHTASAALDAELRRIRTAADEADADDATDDVFGKSSVDDDDDEDEDDEEDEDEALDRIDDAVDVLLEHSMDQDAAEAVEQIDQAVLDMRGVQEGEEGEGDASNGEANDDDAKDDDDDDDDESNPFAKGSSAAWGRKVAAAIRPVVERRPDFGEGRRVGVEKVAAEELPFDLFEQGSGAFRSAERSVAALAVNRQPERRGRFTPPSPALCAAASHVLRTALGKLRGSFTIDSWDLEKVVTSKISQTDGSILDGELRWHVLLADHARNRRGAIDLSVAIVSGAPMDRVSISADGREIPLTRRALDEHMNVRRDATRMLHRPSHVDRALLEE